MLRRVGIMACTDEAGYGTMAGPLFVGAVAGFSSYHRAGLRDSKTLSHSHIHMRAQELLEDESVVKVVQMVLVSDIDRKGPLVALTEAHREAFRRVCSLAATKFGAGVCRGMRRIADGTLKVGNGVESIPRADSRFQLCSAASILAKHTQLVSMKSLAKLHPEYEFDKHNGYGTPLHLQKIRELGRIPGVHRTGYKLPEEKTK